MWFSKERSVDPVLFKLCVDLRATVTDLESQVASLRAQHLKLRGRVYALWGAEQDSPAAPAADGSPKSTIESPKTRDELRASLVKSGRFIPGKPPVHQE